MIRLRLATLSSRYKIWSQLSTRIIKFNVNSIRQQLIMAENGTNRSDSLNVIFIDNARDNNKTILANFISLS